MSDNKQSVLCVDDDTCTLSSLKDALSSHYNVMLALDPEVGLNLAIKHVPDLILLDISMPNLSGLDIAKMLKKVESTAEIPILFLTAYDSPFERKQATEIKAAGFLSKPCSLDDIRDAVGQVLATE